MLPAWVYKRDGRLVPFEADHICQGLFEASEAIGRPNAFLAREMTDGVLHFLAQEQLGETTTTAHIAEMVVKVVRELGQPELSQAVGETFDTDPAPLPISPRTLADIGFVPGEDPVGLVDRCVRHFSLQTIFSRDLAAAEREGLLELRGLDQPRQLAGMVLDSAHLEGRPTWKQAWLLAKTGCQKTGHRLILDSPEWTLAGARLIDQREWIHGLFAALAGSRTSLAVQVATRLPPTWAQERALGPLFGREVREQDAEARWSFLSVLAEEWRREKPDFPFHIDWHIVPGDNYAAPLRTVWSNHLLEAVESGLVRFVFDRPKAPILLGEGMSRQHPGVLMEVGLHLDRFLRMPRIQGDAAVFLDKLPTLVRMAVTAGVQKRKYLRQHADPLRRGFLLDRSRLVLVPLGLRAVVQNLLGGDLPASRFTQDLGRTILRQLQETAQTESRQAHLEILLALPLDRQADPEGDLGFLETYGELQNLAGEGPFNLQIPCEAKLSQETFFKILDFAAHKTGLMRLTWEKQKMQLKQMELV